MSTTAVEIERAIPQMMQMLTGFWLSRLLHVAASLGVADVLGSDVKSIDEVSSQLRVDSNKLYRMMRALAGAGIFEECQERSFKNNGFSELLKSSGICSLRDIAVMLGEDNFLAWNYLQNTLLTSASPFEMAYGQPFYEFIEQNPATAKRFNDSMAAILKMDIPLILEHYNFREALTVVDLGGGYGDLLLAVLDNNPSATGTLFELPPVIESVKALHVNNIDRQNRLLFQAGDFFKSVPENADLYILSRVLRGFGDPDCRKLLENINEAMAPGAKLLVLEYLLDDSANPLDVVNKIMDVNMMVFTPDGKDRTLEAHGELLTTSGFQVQSSALLASGISILEAVKR